MSFEYVQKGPDAKEILETMPLPSELKTIKMERDKEIRAVITGATDTLLLLLGPCSAHEEDAGCDYIARLARGQDEGKDKIIIIPRIDTNKPRTTGIGYKGMAHQ